MDRIADVSCQIPNPDNPVSTDNGNVSKSLKRPFPGISGSESEDPANQKRFIVKASKKSQNHVAEKEGESTCNKGYFGKFKARVAFHVHHYRQRFYSYMTGKNDQFPLLSQMQERRCMPVKNEQLQDEQLQDELIKALIDVVNNNDTAKAERLISIHGANDLSRYRCSFSFSDKTYPDITPFALACRFGHLGLVRGLYVTQEQLNQAFTLENGTDGRTALMLAVMKGHVEVVEQLLEWGANPQILDEAGMVVDEINLGFNKGATQDKIRNLLIKYREERNLQPFKEPDFGFYSAEGIDGINISINPESLIRLLGNLLDPNITILIDVEKKPR